MCVVKLHVSVAEMCVVCSVLVRFVHALVLGAWLLSFSFKHNIWRGLNTSGLLNIWCTVILMAITGSCERDFTATSGLGHDSARPTEGSIADTVKTLH